MASRNMSIATFFLCASLDTARARQSFGSRMSGRGVRASASQYMSLYRFGCNRWFGSGCHSTRNPGAGGVRALLGVAEHVDPEPCLTIAVFCSLSLSLAVSLSLSLAVSRCLILAISHCLALAVSRLGCRGGGVRAFLGVAEHVDRNTLHPLCRQLPSCKAIEDYSTPVLGAVCPLFVNFRRESPFFITIDF